MISERVNIKPNELVSTQKPVIVGAELDSSICVCLFTEDGRGGGVLHFSVNGEPLIHKLIGDLCKLLGVLSKQLKAKIVGGSEGLGNGQVNIDTAKKILGRLQIPIVAEDTGGSSGREIIFNVLTGRLQVAYLNNNPRTIDHSQTSVIKNRVRVLIVDDSKTIRDLLVKILSEDPKIEIVGQAEDPIRAEFLLGSARPDVITLDVHMPRMTGVQWLKKLLPKFRIPVVMITSLELKDGNEVFEALELGAVDYIQKPSMKELSIVSSQIREKIISAASAKVKPQAEVRKFVPSFKIAHGFDPQLLVAIGSSTGGTEALRRVLLSLPREIPPIVIVQHIPAVFSKAFADRMNSLCPFEVKEAESGDAIHSNRVLVAPGGMQMKLVEKQSGLFVDVNNDAPVNRHKPSVDYLFNSVADIKGKKSIGIILTGMGADGAKGLLRMKQSGAQTFSQDEASCVVYGMPKAAWEMGASQAQVGIEDIGAKLIDLWSLKSAKDSHSVK